MVCPGSSSSLQRERPSPCCLCPQSRTTATILLTLDVATPCAVVCTPNVSHNTRLSLRSEDVEIATLDIHPTYNHACALQVVHQIVCMASFYTSVLHQRFRVNSPLTCDIQQCAASYVEGRGRQSSPWHWFVIVLEVAFCEPVCFPVAGSFVTLDWHQVSCVP